MRWKAKGGHLMSRELSNADFYELMALRYLLQGTALRASVEKGGLEWEIAVEAAFEAMRAFDTKKSGDPVEFFALYKEFHIAIIAECGVRRLIEFVDLTLDQCAAYLCPVLCDDETEVRKPLDHWRDPYGHSRLLEAALNRDVEAASEQLSIHLLARNCTEREEEASRAN